VAKTKYAVASTGTGTYRFVGFGADVKRTLELVNHAWNEPALHVRKVRDDEKRACVLVPLGVC
jgi:hypothetical protein